MGMRVDFLLGVAFLLPIIGGLIVRYVWGRALWALPIWHIRIGAIVLAFLLVLTSAIWVATWPEYHFGQAFWWAVGNIGWGLLIPTLWGWRDLRGFLGRRSRWILIAAGILLLFVVPGLLWGALTLGIIGLGFYIISRAIFGRRGR